MPAAIHTEARFEDEVCETLKANGWLCDGPLPYQPGHAYDAGYDKRVALNVTDCKALVAFSGAVTDDESVVVKAQFGSTAPQGRARGAARGGGAVRRCGLWS